MVNEHGVALQAANPITGAGHSTGCQPQGPHQVRDQRNIPAGERSEQASPGHSQLSLDITL